MMQHICILQIHNTKGAIKIFMKSGDYAAVNFLYISTILMSFFFFFFSHTHAHMHTHKQQGNIQNSFLSQDCSFHGVNLLPKSATFSFLHFPLLFFILYTNCSLIFIFIHNPTQYLFTSFFCVCALKFLFHPFSFLSPL